MGLFSFFKSFLPRAEKKQPVVSEGIHPAFINQEALTTIMWQHGYRISWEPGRNAHQANLILTPNRITPMSPAVTVRAILTYLNWPNEACKDNVASSVEIPGVVEKYLCVGPQFSFIIRVYLVPTNATPDGASQGHSETNIKGIENAVEEHDTSAVRDTRALRILFIKAMLYDRYFTTSSVIATVYSDLTGVPLATCRSAFKRLCEMLERKNVLVSSGGYPYSPCSYIRRDNTTAMDRFNKLRKRKQKNKETDPQTSLNLEFPETKAKETRPSAEPEVSGGGAADSLANVLPEEKVPSSCTQVDPKVDLGHITPPAETIPPEYTQSKSKKVTKKDINQQAISFPDERCPI